jgi:hypothetical protein
VTERAPLPWKRFLAGLLLAPPILVLFLTLWDGAIEFAYGTEGWYSAGPPLIVRHLIFCLAWAAGMALPAWLLWKYRKVRLRHHLLAGLALGSIPVLITLAEFLDAIRAAPDAPFNVPYPCAELVRHETFNLQGGVGTMLEYSLMMVLLKWITHGFTHETTSWGWKLAGGAYILAWAIFIAEPFNYVNRSIPSWTYWIAATCEQILR